MADTIQHQDQPAKPERDEELDLNEKGRLMMGGFRHGRTAEPVQVASEELNDLDAERDKGC